MGKMLGAREVMDALDVGETKAYATIRTLNEELERAGYLTVRGRVPEKYLEKRFFGFQDGGEV